MSESNKTRRILTAIIWATLLSLLYPTVSFAVRVNNLGGHYEDESASVEQKCVPEVIGQTGSYTSIELKLIAAVDEKPIYGVMVYLKRIPGEDVIKIHNTGYDGTVRINNIQGKKRVLFIDDGKGVRLFQRLTLAPGILYRLTVVMPYTSMINVRVPSGKKYQYSCYAMKLLASSSDPRRNDGFYQGEQIGQRLIVRVPPGRYIFTVEPYDNLHHLPRLDSPVLRLKSGITKKVKLTRSKYQ